MTTLREKLKEMTEKLEKAQKAKIAVESVKQSIVGTAKIAQQIKSQGDSAKK